MEDLMLQEPKVEGQIDTDALICCKQCGTMKPRSDYRKVTNPEICLDCYKKNRSKRRLVRESTNHRGDKVVNSIEDERQKKQRVTLHLSTRAQSILVVLGIRRSSSQSEVVENMLMRQYEEMDMNEKKFVHFVEESSS